MFYLEFRNSKLVGAWFYFWTKLLGQMAKYDVRTVLDSPMVKMLGGMAAVALFLLSYRDTGEMSFAFHALEGLACIFLGYSFMTTMVYMGTCMLEYFWIPEHFTVGASRVAGVFVGFLVAVMVWYAAKPVVTDITQQVVPSIATKIAMVRLAGDPNCLAQFGFFLIYPQLNARSY